jgi:hypothetical protein
LSLIPANDAAEPDGHIGRMGPYAILYEALDRISFSGKSAMLRALPAMPLEATTQRSCPPAVSVRRPATGFAARRTTNGLHPLACLRERARLSRLELGRSDFSMSSGNRTGWSEAASVLLRSYAADLRSWMAAIAVGYAIGVALVVGGVLMALAGIAVGVVALFHFIALRLGPELAYAIVGGGFLALGLVLLSTGMAVIRRRVPSPPPPRRQAEAAKQVIIRPAATRMVAGLDIMGSVRADLATQLMAGAAATLLLAWVGASRRRVRR